MFAMNFRTPLGKQKQTKRFKSPKPRLRSEAKREETSFYSQANKTQFHKKS